ncbi:helix-turn-helix transcriptional regulator [Cryptosporangium aurantiacum]|uniref:Regulatory protein, luxR family n=1 Tax=Cryptosporangium aurantiacum TaxID=134849 RepID=A0A1M7RIJ9_9ACTN|nr:LuxR family transcriptional regulator [Cryptosporangium aurantiacum]SHN45971.1 regulatory protein, luxR family [Cryptosporangium aurantiacum]
MTISPVPGSLIGRDLEIAKFDRWITGCLQGDGRAVLIDGEPGIGKSTLMRTVSLQAAEAGFTVYRGAGDELGQALPLLPFLDALEVRESTTDQRRRAALQLLRGEFSTGAAVDAVTAASEQLFALIEQLCEQSPTLLVIDDLQWADPTTVALWGRLAKAARQLPLPLPLFLLGLARPTPQGDSLRALRRAVEPGELVRLGPLADDDVTALLTSLTGARPGAELTRLADGAAGNPLYLTELIGALSRGSYLTETEPGTVDVVSGSAPRTLTAAIADRLGFLSEKVRGVLRAAALLGVRFAVDDLALVLKQSVTDLLPSLEEAIAAGVLADTPEGLGFRHPLIRTALYEELPASVRSALHRDAGRALAAAHAPVERVARQLLSADDPSGPRLGPLEPWVQDWLAEAGPALVAQAPQAAADLLRRATTGWPARAADDVLSTMLANALFRLGNAPEEAVQVAVAALDRVTDPDLLVELHWIRSQAQMQVGETPEAVEALQKALADPSLSSRHRARLLISVGRVHRMVGQVQLAEKAAEQARTLAIQCNDRWALAWALHLLSIAKVTRGGSAESLSLYDDAIAATADDLSLTDLRLLVQINRAIWLGDLDRYPEALEALREVRDEAARVGSAIRTAQAYTALCELYFENGQWDDALADLNAVPDEARDQASACQHRGMVAAIYFHRGESEAGLRNLAISEAHEQLLGLRVIAAPALARSLRSEQAGRPDEALASLLDSLTGEVEELDEMEGLLPDAIRLAVECNNPDGAAHVLRLANEAAARSANPHRVGTALYCRGLHDGDAQLLLQAAEQYLVAGRPLFRAAALEAAAARFAELGERAEARAAFSRALDGYQALDARWDAARLQNRFREYGIRRAPRVKHRQVRSGWDSLTPTEAKIAELVTQGMSNPQIAAQLFLSPRTVSTHVSHILSKLDLRSRIDLAREAARRAESSS